jgi:hypothetical protein
VDDLRNGFEACNAGAIIRGISEGMLLRFLDFPSSGSIWVIEVIAHEIESSERTFYRAARLVTDQAFSLCEMSMGDLAPR